MQAAGWRSAVRVLFLSANTFHLRMLPVEVILKFRMHDFRFFAAGNCFFLIVKCSRKVSFLLRGNERPPLAVLALIRAGIPAGVVAAQLSLQKLHTGSVLQMETFGQLLRQNRFAVTAATANIPMNQRVVRLNAFFTAVADTAPKKRTFAVRFSDALPDLSQPILLPVKSRKFPIRLWQPQLVLFPTLSALVVAMHSFPQSHRRRHNRPFFGWNSAADTRSSRLFPYFTRSTFRMMLSCSAFPSMLRFPVGKNNPTAVKQAEPL